MTSSATSWARSSAPAGSDLPGVLEVLREVVRGAADEVGGEGGVEVHLLERAAPASFIARQRARNAARSSSRLSIEVATRRRRRRPSRRSRPLRGARRSASSVRLSDISSRLATSWMRSSWSAPGSSRVITGRDGAQRGVAPLGRVEPPCSSARSTSNRATGTGVLEPRAHRLDAVLLDDVGRVCPPGAARRAASSPPGCALVSAPSATRPATASWPAASGSWQSSTVGASRRSASTWSSVSAVPIEQTDSGTPAWRSAITSV